MSPDKSRSRWWLCKGDEPVHEAMLQVYDQVRSTDGVRLSNLAQTNRLYGNKNFDSLTPGSSNQSFHNDDLLKYNLIRSIIDTLGAKVGAQRPRPIFVTDQGKWNEQQRAKGMTRALYGEFYRNDYYDLSMLIFRDSAIMGAGIIKVFADDESKVKLERVYPWELFVDRADGWYGNPRSIYQRKAIDRAVLAEMFSDHATEIELASSATNSQDWVGQGSVADRIEVVEAWHLPSSKKAADGRHVIAMRGVTLLDEPWVRKTFPFAILPYGKAQSGFWGSSLTEDIAPQQVELNLILEKTQDMMSLSVPRVYVPRGAKISKNHLSNVPGDVIEYSGMQPPIHTAPNGLPPEYLLYSEKVKSYAFETSGISQLSASALKPAGIDSGVALREVNDQQSDRFTTVSRQLEKFALDVGELIIETIREIAGADGSYKIQALDERGRSSYSIDWADVDLDAESYVMQIYAAGLLPTRPEARMQTVLDLLQGGLIETSEAQMLLDFPDTSAATASRMAPYEIVDKSIYRMLNDGVEVVPEGFWNLKYALKQAQNQYCLTGMMVEPPPEQNRELLRRFMTLTKGLIDASEVQAPPPPQEQQSAMADLAATAALPQ